MSFTKPNRTGKSTPNDRVMTPLPIAKLIIEHFNPSGLKLDNAKGNGAFYNQMQEPKDWCEIAEGRDFFDYNGKVDWIITNPPFSIFDNFLLKSLEISDNVVFLTTLNKVFKNKKIDDAITRYGGIKEILILGGGGVAGFPFGFPIGAIHYKKNWKGDIKITRLYQTKGVQQNDTIRN